MNSNKNLDLARKVFPYNEDQRVAYMLGLEEGYDQAMQDFLEKACVSFCKQCPWRCKYDITQGEYCKNLHDFKQTLIQE